MGVFVVCFVLFFVGFLNYIRTDFYFVVSNHMLNNMGSVFFLKENIPNFSHIPKIQTCFNKWSHFSMGTFPLNWTTCSVTLSLVTVVFSHGVFTFPHA